MSEVLSRACLPAGRHPPFDKLRVTVVMVSLFAPANPPRRIESWIPAFARMTSLRRFDIMRTQNLSDPRHSYFIVDFIPDKVKPGTGQVHLGLKHIEAYRLAVAI